MKYYLVDYENVKKDGLKGLEELTEQDTVYIFYSEKADTITFELHWKLNEARAHIEYQRVEVGTPNALDFQLATWLGNLIGGSGKQGDEYFLVTRDSGYNCLCDYWTRREISVSMLPSLVWPQNEKPMIKEAVTEKQKKRGESDRDQRLKEIGETIPKGVLSGNNTREKTAVAVLDILEQCDTKQEFHNALVKKYGNEKNKQASKIYKAMKPLFKNMKGK